MSSASSRSYPIRHAFSLVELSIVLVILGLLVGGVLSGQSLIRAAELRSVVTQRDRYLTAVRSFKDKYFALPGDMNNATQFWGAAAVPASCATTVGTGTQTCDGDGDGVVIAGLSAGGTSYENFRFWQHLANAGLIEGQYSGIGPFLATVANSPSGKIGSTLWAVLTLNNAIGSTQYFNGFYQNCFIFGGAR